MSLKKISKLLSLAAVVLPLSAFAGTFDCSVVYDEFDSLMNKQFIINPAAYVNTVSGKLSRADYNNIQKGKFLATPEHKGYGVAMVRTNKNTYGKFLFTWGLPSTSGHPSLIIKDATLFGRVLDGFAPRKLPQYNIPTSYTIDLDTGAIGAGANADVWYHNVDGNTMFVEAINGANLYFPMESLCK